MPTIGANETRVSGAPGLPAQLQIDSADFIAGIKTLHQRWTGLSDGNEWRDIKIVESYGALYLRITKDVQAPAALSSGDAGETRTTRRHPAMHRAGGDVEDYDDDEIVEDLDEEEDEEALLPLPSNPHGTNHSSQPLTSTTTVVYDIVYSPTYRVPVLYLGPRQPNNRPWGLDELYASLVPASDQQQVRSIGILGALTMGEHPVTGLPAYFVHPCRTGEGMAAICGKARKARDGKGQGGVDGMEYLMMWLGLVGAGVGLSVPVALAKALEEKGR